MDRRHFLNVSGATLAALLTGCGGGSSSGDSGGATPVPSSGLPAAWQPLANKLSSNARLILPAAADFNQKRLGVNARYDNIVPQAVVQCAVAQDVVETLAYAKTNNIAITARSGGHSYAGYSNTTGIVIDLGLMNTVQVNAGTATVGPGTRLASFYDQLAAQGVGVPAGTCGSVGIAGITLGGGVGIVDRAYGLTCDNLVAAEVVLADGRIVTANASQNSDLFWALRGGGGGNFGIVTSLTFQTHTAQPMVRFGAVFSFADAAKALAAWQTWGQTLPNEIWSNAVFWFNGGAESDLAVTIAGFSLLNLAATQTRWDAFLAAAGAVPIAGGSSAIGSMSYRSAVLTDCNGSPVASCAEQPHYTQAASSDFFDAWLPPEGIQALLNAVRDRQVAGKTGGVILDLMGGAIANVASDATAFVHRNAKFSAQYLADYFAAPAQAELDAATAWTTGLRTVMAPWSSGRAYQNYVDPGITNWKQAYYGSNYARLVQVKAKYDPTRVFNFAQGIPTS